MRKSVDWGYYDATVYLSDEYLPPQGQGETMATQIATCVNKLIYKWYNDGDVFDNNHGLDGWANDLSSFANWLYTYTDAGSILERIYDIKTEGEYEDLLKDMHDLIYTPEYLAEMDKRPAQGDVYDCDGPFEFYNGGYCEDCGERLEGNRGYTYSELCRYCDEQQCKLDEEEEEREREEEEDEYDDDDDSKSTRKSFNSMVKSQRSKRNMKFNDMVKARRYRMKKSVLQWTQHPNVSGGLYATNGERCFIIIPYPDGTFMTEVFVSGETSLQDVTIATRLGHRTMNEAMEWCENHQE